MGALYSTQTNGWVHHDIKLNVKNVVKRICCKEGHWMIIDLEYAAKLDRYVMTDWPWFNREGYPIPEREEKVARPAHDM